MVFSIGLKPSCPIGSGSQKSAGPLTEDADMNAYLAGWCSSLRSLSFTFCSFLLTPDYRNGRSDVLSGESGCQRLDQLLNRLAINLPLAGLAGRSGPFLILIVRDQPNRSRHVVVIEFEGRQLHLPPITLALVYDLTARGSRSPAFSPTSEPSLAFSLIKADQLAAFLLSKRSVAVSLVLVPQLGNLPATKLFVWPGASLDRVGLNHLEEQNSTSMPMDRGPGPTSKESATSSRIRALISSLVPSY
ncbi:hypothetical protein TSUD_30640 [Trifolium subterraneum]|uniref:Uncharacterized protein n=1 Tax=Trifolium subterraneum TaxID=3900 RepID=A0A2Z6P0P1_TRISU|nr:hypothetical protein TSUD_30640 [Trifolium subterraneum]